MMSLNAKLGRDVNVGSHKLVPATASISTDHYYLNSSDILLL